MKSRFPVGDQLETILKLSTAAGVEDLVHKSLLAPLEDIYGRPGKRFRSQIVELGYLLSDRHQNKGELSEIEKSLCLECSDVLEALHTGSLVVDDIQDGSKTRRGQPTLHLKYGVPVALNAGNWLYFWPMKKIRALGLAPHQELRLYHLCHETLLRAHFGQAIDVGVPIDTLPQERVYSVCLASLELKSGALMGLAMTLGASIAGASEERLALLEEVGHQFGVALQMFDDLGNLRAKAENLYTAPKKYEDLLLKRPSWVWAAAAQNSNPKDYADFIKAVNHLPDDSFLVPWIEIHGLIPSAKKLANQHLSQTFSKLREKIQPSERESLGLQQFQQLGERLANSYD